MSMNKIFLAGIIVAIVAVLSIFYYDYSNSNNLESVQTKSTLEKPIVSEGFTTFESKELDITINYPQKWKVKETKHVNYPSVIFSKTGIFSGNLDNGPYFSISSSPTDDDIMDTTEFEENLINSLSQNEVLDEYNYSMYDKEISGMNAIVVELELEFLNKKIKSLSYYLQIDDSMYVILYNTYTDTYESNLDIANEMFSSLRFI